MADIALRSYINEIDGMIDGKQLDEAVAHCRHILGYYPKHIDAYRLLGKALLDKGRHGDAADIFQRVLSAVPDDFIAHVGMSIVREDEANLDAALWHMERAFEATPGNNAIQEELRRLYGRRDGVLPAKTRLTRGALARMYVKGELYPQAETELRAALATDPDRVDLETVLAHVYWESDRRDQAVETCNTIVQKLPYHLEANRLLALILNDQGRATEAVPFRQRLEALDPYEAHADPAHNGQGAALANPDSVRLPRLDYTPGMEAAGTSGPEWVTSIGMQFEQPAVPNESTPDWLSEVGAGTDNPFAAGLAPADDVPDWLQSASPAANRGRVGFTSDAEAEPAADWMADLGTPSFAIPEGEAPAETDTPWITADSVKAEDSSNVAAGTNWLKSQTGPLATNDVPDWMRTGPLKMPESVAPSQPDETPDWMKALAPEEPAAPSAEDEDPLAWMKAAAPAQAIADNPAVVSEEQMEWVQPVEATPDEVPAWMQDVALPPAPSADETPDWLKGIEPLPGTGQLKSPTKPLKRLTDRLNSKKLEPPTPELPDDAPDWMKSVATEQPSEDMLAWRPEAAPQAPVSDGTTLFGDEAAEVPAWMQGAAPQALAGDEGTTLFGDEAAEIPAWMQGAAPQTPAGDEGTTLFGDEAADMPDWMQGDTPETPLANSANLSGEMPLWMQTAATQSPAAEEESLAPGEMPDWMQPPAAEAPAPKPPAPRKATAADLPDFLQIASEESIERANEPTHLADDFGDENKENWLKEVARSKGLAPQVPEDAVIEGDVPDWVKAMMPSAPAAPASSSVSAPAAGGNLDAFEAALAAAEAKAQAKSVDWGALESEEPAAPAEAEAPLADSEAPDWMQAPGTPDWMQAPAAPDWLQTPAAETPAPADSTPDWMQAATDTEPAESAAFDWADSAPPGKPVPEWLRAPGEASPLPPADWLRAPVESATPAEEEVDWMDPNAMLKMMQTLGVGAETPAAEPAEALPDWMQTASESETPISFEPAVFDTAASAEPAPAQPAAEEEIDWMDPNAMLKMMQSMDAETPATEPPAEEPISFAPAVDDVAASPNLTDDKPDWLKQMEAEADAFEAQTAPAPQAVEPAPAAEEEIDWMDPNAMLKMMQSMNAETTPPAEPPIEEPSSFAPAVDEVAESPAFAIGKPDWLTQMESDADTFEFPPPPAPQATEPAPAQPAAEEEIDWMDPNAMLKMMQTLGVGAETPAAEPAEALPDWMQTASESETPISFEPAVFDTAASAEPAPAHPAAEEEIDWMDPNAMLKMMQTLGVGAETPAAEPAEALPDWMQTASESETPVSFEPAVFDTAASAEPAPAHPATEEEIDWMDPNAMLKMMQSMGAETPAAEPPAEEPISFAPAVDEVAASPDLTDDKPDWLKQMEAEADAFEAQTAPAPQAVEPAPAAEEEIDWMDPNAMLKMMQSMGVGAETPPAPEPVAEEPVAEAMPDWMQTPSEPEAPISFEPAVFDAASSEVVTPPAAEEDLPPFMRSTRASAEPAPATEEEIDWMDPNAMLKMMQSMNAETPPAPEPVAEPPAPAAPAAAEEEIDWMDPNAMLKMMQSMNAETPPAPEPVAEPPAPVAPAAEEEIDWMDPNAMLKMMQSMNAEATPPAPEPPAPAAEEEIDWMDPNAMLKMMQSMNAEAGTSVAEPTTPEPVAAESEGAEMAPEDAAKWLASLETASADEIAPIEPGIIPDWIKAAQTTAPPEPKSPPTPATAADNEMSPDEAMRWLENLAAKAPEASGDDEVAPAEPAEIPEWIRAVAPPAPSEPPAPPVAAVTPPASPKPKVVEPPPPPIVEPPAPVVVTPPPAPEPLVEEPPAEVDKLSRLAGKLGAARRAKEVEIAARFESQRSEQESARRSIQEKMEKRKTETGKIGTGSLRKTGPLSPPPDQAPASGSYETEKLGDTSQLPPAPKPAVARPKPMVRTAPKPKAPRRAVKSASPFAAEPPENVLQLGRDKLTEGEEAQATEAITYLLLTNQLLPQVIGVLEEHTHNNPGSFAMLQLLGDAYNRGGHLQLALDTYRKALGQV